VANVKRNIQTDDPTFKLDLELLETIYKLNLNEEGAGVSDVASIYLTRNPHPTITKLKQGESQWHNLSEKDYELVVNINRENQDRIRGLLYDLQDKRFIWNKEDKKRDRYGSTLARARSMRHVFALDYALTEKGLKHIETYGSLGGLTLVDAGAEGQLSLADQSGALSLKELQQIARQSLLTEQQLLIESRLSKAIDKYAKKWGKALYDKDPRVQRYDRVKDTEAAEAIKKWLVDDNLVIATNIIKRTARRDPSGNNKYLDWILKQTLKDAEPLDEIEETVREFHAHLARIKKKDIYQYKNLTQLRTAINEANKGNLYWFREDQIEDLIKNDIRWIYKKGNVTVAKPMSMEASIYLGHDQCREDQTGVKWCTARRQKDMSNFFPSYSGGNTFLYYIIDSSQKHPYKKVAIALTKDDHEMGYGYNLEIFDSDDRSIGEHDQSLYGQSILQTLYGDTTQGPARMMIDAIKDDFGSRKWTRLAELTNTDDLNKLHKLFYSGQTSMQTQLLQNPNIPTDWIEDAARNTNKLPKNQREDHAYDCLKHPNAGPNTVEIFLPMLMIKLKNDNNSYHANHVLRTIALSHAKHGGKEAVIDRIYNALIKEFNTLPKSLIEYMLITPRSFNDFFGKRLDASGYNSTFIKSLVGKLLTQRRHGGLSPASINKTRDIFAKHASPEVTEKIERSAIQSDLPAHLPARKHIYSQQPSEQDHVNHYGSRLNTLVYFYLTHVNTSVTYNEIKEGLMLMFEKPDSTQLAADPRKPVQRQRWNVTGRYIEGFRDVYGGRETGYNKVSHAAVKKSSLDLFMKLLKDIRNDVDLERPNNVYTTLIHNIITRQIPHGKEDLFTNNLRNELEGFLQTVDDPTPIEQRLYKVISPGFTSGLRWGTSITGKTHAAHSNKRRTAWEKKHRLDSIDESVLNDIVRQTIKGF